MSTILPPVAIPRRSRSGHVPAGLPAGLLLLTVPLLRPGVFGEVTALGGLVVALAAGVAALVRRERVAPRPVPAVTVLAALLCAAYLYLVVHAVFFTAPVAARAQFQDFALTMGSVLGGALALSDPDTRRALGRGLVLVLAAFGASWLVTAAVWVVAGVGAAPIGSVLVGNAGLQPVYFPFTVSYSTSAVLGLDVPRLAGVGRESGWMAMYCAAGWFLADAVGYRSVLVKVLLLAGLVGTLSTAGFGVFVVVLAVHAFLRPRGPIGPWGMARQIGGLGAMAGAVWLAVEAPVLGLAAKETSNETSLVERQDATAAGLRALTEHPLGGQITEAQSGVNLISDVAVDGLPFVLGVLAALVVPVLVTRGRDQRRAGAVALVVLLTLLVSQPPAASTWAFLLVAVALACDGLTEDERAAPGRPGLAPLHRRLAGARPDGGPA